MTMQHSTHPDDERLGAYASADAEVVSDRELAAHVSGCDRCRPMVDELTILHDALSHLPDIAPSRPLRLIPPVIEPAARPSGALEWLRRLTAPAMAAGAGLVLVGAVGASGLVGGFSGKAVDLAVNQESSKGAVAPGAGGGHSPVPAVSTSSEFDSAGSSPRGQGTGASPTPEPSAGAEHATDRGSSGKPWFTILIAGFGLFGISAMLRYSLTPRAG